MLPTKLLPVHARPSKLGVVCRNLVKLPPRASADAEFVWMVQTRRRGTRLRHSSIAISMRLYFAVANDMASVCLEL